MSERPARFAEVDWIKSVGILTVVLIHVVRSPFEPGASWGEIWISQFTRFAVPGFLAASGFLYATSRPVSWATTRTRLLRIAVPYLVFSTAAQLLRAAQETQVWGPGSGSIARDLVFAASLGPYYYVFIAAILVVLTPGFARLSHRGLLVLLAVGLAAQGYFEVAGSLSFFWHLRNPLLWLAWFQLGWLARLHHEALVARASERRFLITSGLVAVALAGVACLGLELPPMVRRLVQWLTIFPVLAALLVASCGRSVPPRIARVVVPLSEATYTLYLLHLFVLIPLRQLVHAAPGQFEPLTIAGTWLVAVLASCAVAALGRRLLGRHSRTWIGS